jgi:hypothetical protein
MKRLILILVVLMCGSISFAQQSGSKQKQPEKEKTKLLQSLNLDSWNLAIRRSDPQVQEEVKVEAEEYPGLSIDVQTPVESLGVYHPYTKQELQAYSDLLTDYTLTDYQASGTARPHKHTPLFRVSVPD